MSYTGIGDVSASHWTYVATANVCKPNDATTLEQFKTLQRLINRVRAKHGQKLLAVDGRIGPSTLSAVKDLRGPGVVVPPLDFCPQLAVLVDESIKELSSRVIAEEAPPVADPKTSSPPSLPGPAGTVVNPTDKEIERAAAGGFLDTLKSPLGITALVVGGLLVWKLSSGGKRRRRR